jgi:hypothetical protein
MQPGTGCDGSVNGRCFARSKRGCDGLLGRRFIEEPDIATVIQVNADQIV